MREESVAGTTAKTGPGQGSPAFRVDAAATRVAGVGRRWDAMTSFPTYVTKGPWRRRGEGWNNILRKPSFLLHASFRLLPLSFHPFFFFSSCLPSPHSFSSSLSPPVLPLFFLPWPITYLLIFFLTLPSFLLSLLPSAPFA